MRTSRKCIYGATIQTKARQLAEKVNLRLPSDEQITAQFSDGWLQNLEKRWQLQSFKLNGKAGDVNEAAIQTMLEKTRNNMSIHAVNGVFSCDEYGLFYQTAADSTIAASSFTDRKTQKACFTFSACCYANKTERCPLMFIGDAASPR